MTRVFRIHLRGVWASQRVLRESAERSPRTIKRKEGSYKNEQKGCCCLPITSNSCVVCRKASHQKSFSTQKRTLTLVVTMFLFCSWKAALEWQHIGPSSGMENLSWGTIELACLTTTHGEAFLTVYTKTRGR